MKQDEIRAKYLFAPGPVLTSRRVKEAAIMPDLCHRSKDFEAIYATLRLKLTQLCRGNEDYTSVILTGSGTAANECVVSSVLQEGEEALVASNGEFGERLARLLTMHKAHTHHLSFGWGEELDVGELRACLADNPRIRLVAVVFHETSTGMINPVSEIGALAKSEGALFFVDAISAVGGEEVDVKAQRADFCTGVPNKAIGGLPGLSFVCMRREALRDWGSDVPHTDYLSLHEHLMIADSAYQTPHTPAVQLFMSLAVAVDELLDEGLANRVDRYRRCAQLLRDGIRKLGLRILVPDRLASSTVTSVFLPDTVPLGRFVDRLDERGYIVYPGKGPLKQANMFQAANMGQIDEERCFEFLKVLEECLDELGYGS